MVNVEYIEISGEFMALLKVTESNGSVRECYIPKILIDIIKANLPSINMTNILSRSMNKTYDLS